MKWIKYLRLILALLLFLSAASLVYEISPRSAAQQIRKYDDANLNHMKYGIFNINGWKEKLSSIIVAEIQEFKINNNNKNDLKKHVEGQLETLITKLDTQIKETNKNSTSGWIKQKLINAFVDVKEIKSGIPDYADTIVQEMTHEESQKKLKEVIKGRVTKYLDQTFEPHDMEELTSIVQRSGQKTREEARKYLGKVVPEENKNLFSLAWTLIILATLLFLLAGAQREKLSSPLFLTYTATLLLLLYAGITWPMIDMVANIASFNFMLLGHRVEFTHQIVYFQSKSIIDVFWILMDDPAPSMKFVGVLMIVFSVIFPALKIISSLFYYYNWLGSTKRGWVKYLALNSGKWSMTDVVVVAIMMAYIGFNGMVATQFNLIRATLPQFNLISTNDTTLQIGFFVFLCYVLGAMFLSLLITQKESD